MANLTLTAEEQHMFEGQPRGFPFGDFDLEDVMLPEDDDMGIPSDTDEDGQEEDVQAESGFGNVLGALPPRACLLCLPARTVQACLVQGRCRSPQAARRQVQELAARWVDVFQCFASKLVLPSYVLISGWSAS